MKKIATVATFLTFVGILCLSSGTQAATIDDLNKLMDSARIVEAHIFSPKSWEKADGKANNARQSVKQGRKQKVVDGYIKEAMEHIENALKASEVAKLSLKEYLPPRDKAKEAKAPILVPKLYNKAELVFTNAAKKVESGDVKGGLKEADKSVLLFETAELEGIRRDILGNADKLIDAAVADGADKYALSTLDKARSALTKADGIISTNRYDRETATKEAARAEYEARHADNIAQSVRSLKRNDQAWEKLMLVYEIQMNRVGTEVGIEQLPFDKGPIAAGDSLILYINSLKAERDAVKGELSNLSAALSSTLDKIDYKHTADDPAALAQVVEAELLASRTKVSSMSEQIASGQSKLTELESTHSEMSAELEVRKAQEEKFRAAKAMLNPSEGEVLFNSSNDVVLRLSGISFDVGKSTIKDDHMPLLGKVEEIIKMFPEQQIMVEGHTDASGDATTNAFLSEKRAFAVMQYLRQSLLIPADQIRSIGYGDEKPVASNQNEEGRAKNRRIDVIILR